MKKFPKFKSFLILYPFLFALYPILHLYAINVDQTDFSEVSLFLAIVLVATILIFFFFKLFLKNDHKSALISAIFMFFFLSYGHIFDWISGWKIGIFSTHTNNWIADWTFGRHRYLLSLFFLILLGSFFWLLRTKKSLITHTKVLNFVAIILIIFPLYSIFSYQITKDKIWIKQANKKFSIAKSDTKDLPDIYYIIPDGYARGDILKEYFGYDNKDFIEYLKNQDFFIADKSSSNYALTHLSLPSTLDLDYVNYLSEEYGEETGWHWASWEILSQSKVRKTMRNLGYTWITFDTGYKTSMKDSTDLLLTKRSLSFDMYNIFLNSTPLRAFVKQSFRISPIQERREQVLSSFDSLKEIPKINGPTFTLAHINIPHQPFVFDKKGRVPDETSDMTGKREKIQKNYLNQLIFTNKKLEESIDAIIKRSKKPPVIIIQSDHGVYGHYVTSEQKEQKAVRMSILNAYYFPDQNYQQLYNSITPVNSFRVILNQYFGTDYSFLEDQIFFSWYDNPYKFQEVFPN